MARIDRLEWLESFVAVADHGGFAAAGRILHRAQSRVSTQVAQLERALGRQLFDRHHRPVTLTDAGEAFRLRALAILAEVDAAVAEIDLRSGTVRGRVVVGTHPSIAAGVMPDVIRRLRTDFPQVSVDLTERTTARLARTLLNGSVDVAVRATSPDDRSVHLESYPLWSEPFVAVMRTDHPLAVDSKTLVPLDPQELLRYDLVAVSPPGDALEPELEMLAERWGIDLRLAWRSEQPQVVANMVKVGLGVGILNHLALATSEATGLTSRPITGDVSARVVSVWWDPHRYVSLATRAFFQALLTVPTPAVAAQIPRQPLPGWANPTVARHYAQPDRIAPRASD